MVDGALIGTAEFDTFALDPSSCAEIWRVHEDYPPSLLGVNRGAAYMDGALFRGLQDGRVVAYDFKTGAKLWTTAVDGGIGGGVITYADGGSQKVAVAAGFTSPVWPTK